MSVRAINYTVNENSVTPEASQWGGIQYENNATTVSYTLDEALKTKIQQNYPQGSTVVYRIDFDSPVAGYHPSENIEPTGDVIARDIPLAITISGEPFQSTLVITVLDSQLNEIGTFCSIPSRIYFNSVSREQYSEQELCDNISAMEQSVTDMHSQVLAAAESADVDAKAANSAMQRTEQAKVSLESGSEFIFLGGDAQSQVNIEIAVDGEMSATSENPVQNKVIAENLAAVEASNEGMQQQIDRLLSNGNGMQQQIDKLLRNGDVLWEEGGWYMISGQTAYLSQKISEQKTGIVLKFSDYDVENEQVRDWDYSYLFIPKNEVGANGLEVTYPYLHIYMAYAAAKVFTVYDDRILGSEANAAFGTGGTGITYDNRRRVLRKIFGV